MFSVRSPKWLNLTALAHVALVAEATLGDNDDTGVKAVMPPIDGLRHGEMYKIVVPEGELFDRFSDPKSAWGHIAPLGNTKIDFDDEGNMIDNAFCVTPVTTQEQYVNTITFNNELSSTGDGDDPPMLPMVTVKVGVNGEPSSTSWLVTVLGDTGYAIAAWLIVNPPDKPDAWGVLPLNSPTSLSAMAVDTLDFFQPQVADLLSAWPGDTTRDDTRLI